MKKLYTERGKDYYIKSDAKVRKTYFAATGNIEIKHITNTKNSFCGIKKLNKYEYLVLETREIKNYKQGVNKAKKGLEKSMRNLKYILKNNFKGGKNELFITLTARDEVANIKQIKEMYKSFWRKLKYKYSDLEFVAVFEKNDDSKSWHIHTIVKSTQHKKLTIANADIERLWNYGYTKTNRITDTIRLNSIDEKGRIIFKDKFTEKFGIDKVISYLCKTESKQNISTGERCYETSRGIRKPLQRDLAYNTAREEMGQDYVLDKVYTSLLRDSSNNKIVSKVKTETWKKKKQNADDKKEK